MRTSPQTVTRMIERSRSGDQEALSQLLPIVYDELRRLAAKYMRNEQNRQTLQATALVHEAYMRLLRDRQLRWNDRAHFIAIAARSMRQILVERARARSARKRGGDQQAITLKDEILGRRESTVDVLALEEALQRLAELDPKQAELVELRFFGGLTFEETAEVMGVSTATIKRWWNFAKAWLRREIES